MTEQRHCKKVSYRSRLEAKIALANTQRSRGSTREEIRIYWCPEHRALHLTSKRARTENPE